MADRLDYDFIVNDRGTSTLAKGAAGMRSLDDAASSAAKGSVDLAEAQLKVKGALLNVTRAEGNLVDARKRLQQVTDNANATEKQRRTATVAVQQAEVKHAQSLLSVQRATEGAAKASRQMGSEAKAGADESVKAFGRVGAGAKGVVAQIGAIAKGAKGVALAGGVVAGALLTKGIGMGLDVTKSRAKLNAQLDLTAADAAKVGKLAGKIYAGNYGDSLDQVNQGIRAVITSGTVLRGTQSKDLGAVTQAALTLSSTFDVDVTESAHAAGQMIRTGLAKNGTEAMNLLARAYATGGDNAGDLIDTTVEYGTQLRKLGIDGPQAIGLINQGLKAGARDSDIVADALKEFSIRAVDGSKLTAQGFKMVGLNASDMAERIGRGGKSANDALELTLQKLKAIPDPVKRGQAAVALFGTQAEDLGGALYALDPGAATIGKIAGATDRLNTALSADPGAKLETVKRALEAKVTGGIIAAFTWLQEHETEVGEGMILLARVSIAVAQAFAGVAAAGGYVAAALLYVAAASVAITNRDLAKELWQQAGAAKDAAGKATEFANSLQTKTGPALDQAEAKLKATKAAADRLPREKTILASAPGAVRTAAELNDVRFQAGLIPRSKSVDVNIRSNARTVVADVRAQLNSISDRTTYFTTVLRTVRAYEDNPSGGYAKGVSSAPPGLAWVGERGPELMRFTGGETVIPHARSETLARGYADGTPGAVDAVARVTGARPAGRAAPTATVLVVVQDPSGRVIEQKLVELKNTRGRAGLNFQPRDR